MLGFAEARAFLDVVVKKFLDIEMLLSTSNANQLDNVSLLCTKLHLVFCEQKRTNELLLALLANSNKIILVQDNHPWPMLKEIIEAQYESLQEYKRTKEYEQLKEHLAKNESDQLLELVLKQKQEIENEFVKEFPQ